MTSTVCLGGASGLLAGVEAAVGALCDGTDPAVLLGSDALGSLGRLTGMARPCPALHSALAGRVAHSKPVRGCGLPAGDHLRPHAPGPAPGRGAGGRPAGPGDQAVEGLAPPYVDRMFG